MNVGRAIYNILKNNTAVNSMVGTNISPNRMRQTTGFPFIVYDVVTDEPESQKESVATLDSYTVMVSCYASTYSESNRLGHYVRTAMDRVSGAYGGVQIQAIDFQYYDDIFDDDSGSDGVFRKALNFQVRVLIDINNIYSIDFDGVDDYLAVNGAAGVLDKAAGSISVWAITDTTAASGVYFKSIVSTENSIALSYNANLNLETANYKGSSTSVTATSDQAIEGDGQWHHIVSTWDTSANQLRLYIDGSLETTTGSLPTFSGTMATASIGNNAAGGSYFKGNMDEVSIWNKALSSSEVTTIYNDGYPSGIGGMTGLVGWWRMGDPGGPSEYSTIPDVSSNSNDATMTNMSSADIVPETPNDD